MARAIRSHRQLEVYQRAFTAAMELFELSKMFTAEERYSLTDQIVALRLCELGGGVAQAQVRRRFRKQAQ